MIVDYPSYIVFAILLVSLAWTLKSYLPKANGVVLYGSLAILVILGIFTLLFFGIGYARDLVVFLQLMVFVSDVFRGKLFEKPKKNFYNLTFWEAYCYIGYNLVFKGLYFFYILGSFPDRLSENIRPLGTVVIYAIFVALVFTDNKIRRSREVTFS